ncbi:MAG: GGDEF domain-containing protein [bacterium]|nr:GGDEF domain-containing protein [bacterium]
MSNATSMLGELGEQRPNYQSERSVLWLQRTQALTFAFQPIIHIHTGDLFAVEALIRGFDQLGFSSPFGLFDALSTDGLLYEIDLALREKALNQFKKLPDYRGLKLFYNLDNRIIEVTDQESRNTSRLLEKLGLERGHLCFEISERHEFSNSDKAQRLLEHYRAQHFQIALDDFGTGYAGLKLLYLTEPGYLKVDRFFISRIFEDPKKKLFVGKIVNLAHMMGIKVIAEGVETPQEFFVCREIGCDFVQGFLAQMPTTDSSQILAQNPIIAELVAADRRKAKGESKWLLAQMETLPAVSIHHSMISVLDLMRHHKDLSYFPVVDHQNRPLGLLCEEDLKQYVYSPFGRELMQNRSTGLTVSNFVQDCPTAGLDSPVEEILEIYAQTDAAKGLLITDQGNYLGFLSSNRLLKLLNERNLAAARDSNPLTGLPGNHRITRFIQQNFSGEAPDMILVYFDFDHFKPFNDKEGFRKGDRAILLFADLMSKQLGEHAALLGHIGGDDFFAAFRSDQYEKIEGLVKELRQSFGADVESFYSVEAREKKYIEGRDREGQIRRFPLLQVSAAILQVKSGTGGVTVERISAATASLKKGAKAASSGLCAASLNPRV